MTAICQDHRAAIMYWFMDNDVKIDGWEAVSKYVKIGLENNDPINRIIDTWNPLTGTINCNTTLQINNLRSEPPFKLGQISHLDVRNSNTLGLLDPTYLAIIWTLSFTLDRPENNLIGLVDWLERLGKFNICAITITNKLAVTGSSFIPTIHRLQNLHDKFKSCMIYLPPKIGNTNGCSILIDDTKLHMSYWVTENIENNIGKECNIKFDNVLDLQDWLFDQGAEEML